MSVTTRTAPRKVSDRLSMAELFDGKSIDTRPVHGGRWSQGAGRNIPTLVWLANRPGTLRIEGRPLPHIEVCADGRMFYRASNPVQDLELRCE
jgi:hypothetical protein